MTEANRCEQRARNGGNAELALSPRLFQNPILDKLSRVHHLVPLLLYAPVVVALVWLAKHDYSQSLSRILAGLALGYGIWSLIEYGGHRFLFHYSAKSPFGKRVQFLVHGVHHDHPSDPLRLVMPPLMSVPIMAAAYVVLRLACGEQFVLQVLAGFVVGYVLYDNLHFHLHQREPGTALGKWLRYRHMHHHFRDDSSWFGVSAPWWDVIFASRPDRNL